MNHSDRNQHPGQAASSPAVRRASAQPGVLIRVGETRMAETREPVVAERECWTCRAKLGEFWLGRDDLTAEQVADELDAHQQEGHDVRPVTVRP
jgi:hypothetical protein